VWLIPQSLNSARALACSARVSLPDCEPSAESLAFWVTSSGTPTLRLSSWHGWKARRWSRHLFGPETLRRFDGSNLLASWMLSLRASHVSPTVTPAAGKEPTTTAGFGRQSQSAFAWFDPASSIWKTSPGCDLLGEWLPYSQTWPRSGSISNGTASERLTLAPAIKESGYSSWPTARAEDSESCGNHPGATDSLTGATKHWMTPSVSNCSGNEYTRDQGKKGMERATLVGEAANWPTPDSYARERTNKSPSPNAAVRPTIALAAASWPTPAAHEARLGFQDRTRGMKGSQVSLSTVAMQTNWPTPAGRDYKGSNSSQHMTKTDGRTDGRSRNHADQLPNFVMHYFSPQDQTMNDGPTSLPKAPPSRRRLNPQFVDWMMGWPPGWTNTEPTACDAAAMESWRCKLDCALSNLLGAQESHRAAA